MEENIAVTPFKEPLIPKIYLVLGRQTVSDKMLQLIAALALRQPLTVLDCGNRSNMYAVAKLIRPYTSDPVAVLGHIRLSRAFTCIQVLTMLEAVAARPQTSDPCIVLDLLSTFLDEDVNLPDAERMMDRSLACLRAISQTAPVVISARPLPLIARERASLYEALHEAADTRWAEPEALTAGHLQPALFA